MTKEFNDITNASVDAVIYMKSGERKYGALMERPDGETCQFVSFTNMDMFARTQNHDFIEAVPCCLIEAIDIDLK